MPTHTDEQKAAALAAYLEVGTAQAARELDIPARTIRRWAGEAGLTAAKREQTAGASDALAADIEERRAVVKELLLEAAETHARRSLEAKPREAQALATAAAIMLDKFRLEMGEHTASTRSESVDAAEVARTRIDQLAQRRQAKTA